MFLKHMLLSLLFLSIYSNYASSSQGVFLEEDQFEASIPNIEGGHPEFDTPLEVVSLKLGTISSILCNASGDQPMTYKWYTEYAEEIINSRNDSVSSNISSQGSWLVFSPVKPSVHNKSYICTASNRHGLRNKRFLVLVRNITEDDGEPQFDFSYEYVNISEGVQSMIWCNATGSLPMNYKWIFPSGQEVPVEYRWTYDRIFVMITSQGAALVISRAQLNDSGEYVCNATNYIGYAGKTFFIKVQAEDDGEPRYDNSYEYLVIPEAEQSMIWCNATGSLPMTYKWTSPRGQEVPRYSRWSYNRVYVMTTSQAGALVINRAQLNDSGEYICNATNYRGYAGKTFYIEVQEKNTTDFSVTVNNVTDTSVTFEVQSDLLGYFDTMPLKILYYEFREKRRRVEYVNISEYDGNNTFTIDQLIPSGKYFFTFVANGSFENNTRFLQVVLLPSQPEVIFRKISDGIVEIEWFRTFDDAMRETIDKYTLTYPSARMIGGYTWNISDCSVQIDIPSCSGASYTIANLYRKTYYEISLKAHTVAGYGRPFKNKIYIN